MAANRRLVITPPALLLVAAAREDIVTTARTVTDADGKKATVEQNYYLDTPDEGSPGAVLLVLPGGNGSIGSRREVGMLR